MLMTTQRRQIQKISMTNCCPLLDLEGNNCIKVEPEQCYSIDEQIIPAKSKRRDGVKQYNPKKNP